MDNAVYGMENVILGGPLSLWFAANGYSAPQIQAMGRWKSSAFQKYIRIPSLHVPAQAERSTVLST
jgi:hypothetical protein